MKHNISSFNQLVLFAPCKRFVLLLQLRLVQMNFVVCYSGVFFPLAQSEINQKPHSLGRDIVLTLTNNRAFNTSQIAQGNEKAITWESNKLLLE